MTSYRITGTRSDSEEAMPRPRRPFAMVLAWAVAGTLASWTFAYLSGLFPYIGYESGRLEGPVAQRQYVSGDYPKEGFGFRKFLFFSGQRVFFDYRADVFSGALRISVMKPGVPRSLREHVIDERGRGRFEVPIASTGIYELSIAPATDPETGATPRMTYTVNWGAL